MAKPTELHFGAAVSEGQCPGCGRLVAMVRIGNLDFHDCGECAAVAERAARKSALQRRFLECEAQGLIGAAHGQFTFKNWRPACDAHRPAWEAAWLLRKNMYLWGERGRGKTLLARCALVRGLKDGLVGEITGPMLGDARHKALGTFRVWCALPTLLLDDVSMMPNRGAVGEAAVRQLWELLNARVGLRTIVTAQMAPNSLAPFLTEAIPGNPGGAVAALARLHPFDVFELAGKDLRKPAECGIGKAESGIKGMAHE